ncbi:MAG: rhomboid family intramembrane serine protease [Bacteroidota bacterium]|nr:rhomboid family intramembrane serine protease [Bacteroidota bacterium]
MTNSIIQDLRSTIKNGDMLIKLIFVNSAVFVIFRIIYLFYFLSGQPFTLGYWMSLPSDPAGLLYKPWTLVTYMFYHEGLLHFFFNVLNLYWFGKIFLLYFDEKKLLSIYLLGGLTGGLFYFAVYNLLPNIFPPAILLGASASVIAILFAVAFYAPNFKVFMVFVGEVKLIYIAIFSLLLYVILIASDNPGGNLAHIGGALFGYLWVRRYQRGRDITRGFGKFLESFFALFKRRKMKVTYKRPVSDMDYNHKKNIDQQEIDRILDKISKAGYGSLSKDEKDILFRMSNKN